MSMSAARAALAVAAFTVFGCAVGPAQAQETIGVEACDTFIAKYDACITTKVPAEHQTQFKATIGQLQNAWRPMAANPQMSANLEPMCRQVSQMVQQQTAAFGCSW
jgi:hypothetical protein